MRRAAASVLVVCLLTFALAGCMGGAGDDDSVASLAQDGSGEGDELLGVIEGQVVNEGLEAVEGARVVLHVTEEPLARATTSSTGAYRFEEVPAGQYGVRVLSGCCQEQTQRVELEAGDSFQLDFVLDPLSMDDLKQPYVEAYEWVGLMSCGAGLLGGTVNACILDPNDDSRHVFEVREGVRALSVSVVWDASLTASERLDVVTSSHCAGETQPCDGFGLSDSGLSPVEFTIHNEDIEQPELRWEALENGTWMLRFSVWPSSELVDLAFEQEFTVHYHVHYWQEAPEGYSALPG